MDNCGCLFNVEFKDKLYTFECDLVRGHHGHHSVLNNDGTDIIAIFFDADHYLIDIDKLKKLEVWADAGLFSKLDNRHFRRGNDGRLCLFGAADSAGNDFIYDALIEAYLAQHASFNRKTAGLECFGTKEEAGTKKESGEPHAGGPLSDKERS